MTQSVQAVVGLSFVAVVALMLIFWTKSNRFVAPVVASVKKGRSLIRRRHDLS